MISENVKALVLYRLEQAQESLAASTVLLDQDLIRPSVNRSYYAMFYAVLALLAARKEETSKHSGAIVLFDREFVKPGVFPKEFSRWLHDAFDLRQRSDYSPQTSIRKTEAAEILRQAETFVSQVRAELERMGRPITAE
jgi:uncharacterized protein (UPF0332 family)